MTTKDWINTLLGEYQQALVLTEDAITSSIVYERGLVQQRDEHKARCSELRAVRDKMSEDETVVDTTKCNRFRSQLGSLPRCPSLTGLVENPIIANNPNMPTFTEILEGAERASVRVRKWPKWKRDLAPHMRGREELPEPSDIEDALHAAGRMCVAQDKLFRALGVLNDGPRRGYEGDPATNAGEALTAMLKARMEYDEAMVAACRGSDND